MEAAIETIDLLERSGFNKPLTQDSSQSAVYTVKEYHIFYRCFGHIRQFMDGLKLHGVLDIMRLHQQEATQFLGEATALTAEVVNNFYSFSFSDKGDPNRETEEAIVYNFRRFICQVEKGRISSTVINISTKTAEEDSIHVTLELVLQAFVGCPGLPRDISSGLIEFNHNSSALSHVNTCAPSKTFQNTSKL
ncbi:uncharacterized protein LOC128217015 [Mya arenaria]|uniref:uncharacterized protein LOC128217015 n=1 Tax=Mya arenaria TaxID=6604 RepID=UPI0022E379BA|nr:uncharacterized protein LOC128217015 [Mya arenaria]XP_052779778.1 uncharacterized protein LOC128217015 [Mya arenaria]